MDAPITSTSLSFSIVVATAACSAFVAGLSVWLWVSPSRSSIMSSCDIEPRQKTVVELTATSVPLCNPGSSRSDHYDPSPRKGYLSWDDYFMALAFLSAQRSKDPSKQVGAVIVDDSHVIIGIGYNGFPRGVPDSALPWAKKSRNKDPLSTKYPYVVHAEANALLNKNATSVSGARIYVTMFPCNDCSKLLIQAGIKEVIYHEGKVGPRQTAVCGCSTCIIPPTPAASDPSYDDTRNQGKHDQSCASGADRSNQAPTEQVAGSLFSLTADAAVSARPDPSYLASERLLCLAGVCLRQHKLSTSVVNFKLG